MSSTRTRPSRVARFHSAAVFALALALTGCSGTGGTDGVLTAPTGRTDAAPSVPGATSTPEPASWADAVAPEGFTVAVVTAVAQGTDPEIDAAVDAIGARTGAAVSRTVVPPGGADTGDPLTDVLAGSPDLVVVLGLELLDVADRSSASNLGQQFLIIGAQLPEPTANVTAVVWPGATARRADEPRAVPNGLPGVAAHAGDAIQAGLAALIADTTGGVIVLP